MQTFAAFASPGAGSMPGSYAEAVTFVARALHGSTMAVGVLEEVVDCGDDDPILLRAG